MGIISLTTDFGIRDGYVGVMKGVIWGIAPEAKIVDITHLLPAQNVFQGAIALSRVIPYFPPNSVHVAVVDPGVGTNRRPVAARIGDHFFVAPDNGLLSLVVNKALENDQPVKFVHLDRPKYWLKDISHVFHGRDIFSPVGAHLSNGISLEEIGSPINDPILINFPEPEVMENKIIGEVISIDNFGNLATNIFQSHLGNFGNNVIVCVQDHEIDGLIKTFGEKPVGSLVAMLGTQHDLIIARVNQNAQLLTGAKIGDKVVVERES